VGGLEAALLLGAEAFGGAAATADAMDFSGGLPTRELLVMLQDVPKRQTTEAVRRSETIFIETITAG